MDWLEEIKIQRRQTSIDHYQRYQSYLDHIDSLDKKNAVGEMEGKKFKKLTAADANLTTLFNHYINRYINN